MDTTRPETLERWLINGTMSPDRVLERVSSEMRNSLRPDEHAELSENFENISSSEDESGIKRIDEDAFVSFLVATGALPMAHKDVGSILYRSVLYLCRFPFQHLSPLPSSMTLQELSRGLVWFLPGYGDGVYDESNYCRGRTPADYRRVIFQSLATARGGETLAFDACKAKEDADREAFELEPGSAHFRQEWCIPNYDDDGDQMFHDLLDILGSVQPCRLPVGPYPRDSFRPLAREMLSNGNDHVRLHHLSIPTSDFRKLVSFSLATHFDETDVPVRKEDAYQREHIVNSIVKAFTQDLDESVGIIWRTFNEALGNSANMIFAPVCNTLSRFIRSQNCAKECPTTLFSRLMTVPTLEQLGSLLDHESVSYDYLQLHTTYMPGSNHAADAADSAANSAAALGKAIQSCSDGAILLLSGKLSSTGESFSFGVHSPLPGKDGESIQPPQRQNWDRCMLFELTPVQDVFRGQVGQPGWTLTASNELCFGEPSSGASLSFSSDLARATFGQTVTFASDKDDAPAAGYNATSWRGSFKNEVEVSLIELWYYPE